MVGAGRRHGAAAAGMAGCRRCRGSVSAGSKPTACSRGRRCPSTMNPPAPANHQRLLNWHISARLAPLPSSSLASSRGPKPAVPSVGGAARGRGRRRDAQGGWECRGHPRRLALVTSLHLGGALCQCRCPSPSPCPQTTHPRALTMPERRRRGWAAGGTVGLRMPRVGVTLAQAPVCVSLPTCHRESKELPRTPQPFLLISLTPLPRYIVTMGYN